MFDTPATGYRSKAAFKSCLKPWEPVLVDIVWWMMGYVGEVNIVATKGNPVSSITIHALYVYTRPGAIVDDINRKWPGCAEFTGSEIKVTVKP